MHNKIICLEIIVVENLFIVYLQHFIVYLVLLLIIWDLSVIFQKTRFL